MSSHSGAFGLFWKNGKQDPLARDGILALAAGLLVLTLAVVAIAAVTPFTDYETSPGIATGIEAGSARWSALGALYAAENATAAHQAFVRSVALTRQSSVGYAAAGPCSAPVCTLALGPTEAEAYVRRLARAGQGLADETFVRSVALAGQHAAGYAVAGPCSTPSCTLSLGPTEAGAYARSLAQTGQRLADKAFVRSVALAGQHAASYAVAGPCSTPVCTLSLGPTEAGAYARSLAQTGQVLAEEAFVRSVALTWQHAAGYAWAGPCSTPI
jgi:hypothetical protein